MVRKMFEDPFKKKIVEDEARKAAEAAKPKKAETPNASDIDLKDLLGKTRVILWREISELMQESAGKLLSKDSSQALVNYIKLLKDLIKDENELIDTMSDEDLEKIMKGNK
jgi:hypothetical protein